jgi:hypothetical protein
VYARAGSHGCVFSLVNFSAVNVQVLRPTLKCVDFFGVFFSVSFFAHGAL